MYRSRSFLFFFSIRYYRYFIATAILLILFVVYIRNTCVCVCVCVQIMRVYNIVRSDGYVFFFFKLDYLTKLMENSTRKK